MRSRKTLERKAAVAGHERAQTEILLDIREMLRAKILGATTPAFNEWMEEEDD